MEVFYTPHFKREAKRLPFSLRQAVEDRIQKFLSDPFHPSLKTHKLNGKLKAYWSFSIDRKNRIIFEFDGKKRAVFHSIGDHSIYD